MVDYDFEWKILLEHHFEKAVLFFLPAVHPLVDFTVKPVFLEKEIQDTIAKVIEGRKKRKYADKLARVRFKDGKDRWILIHIEVQSSFETHFAKRMFDYYYWISTKYENPDVIALAIYTGSKIPKKYNTYEKKFHGTALTYKFNTYKVREQKEAELLQSSNPFALVILASLYILKTKKDINLRFQYKRKLVELTREKGYSSAEIVALLRFIRYIVDVSQEQTLQIDLETIGFYLKNYGMTIPTKHDIKFASDVYQAITGEDIDRKVQNLKEEIVKAEQEKVKTEQEKIQAEQEKIQAEQEKIQIQQKLKLAIRKLLMVGSISIQEIAKTFSISEEEVLKIKNEIKN